MLFDDRHSGVVIGSYLDTSHEPVTRFDSARVRLVRQKALDALVRALFDGSPSDLRDEIRSVLILYSQSALRTAPIEKLLAILLPLESFLLRNTTESITENIAIRFALAIGETHDERRRIRTFAQLVYGMRSRYLHHRKSITGLEDLETLREFLQYAWRFFLELGLRVVSGYGDRDEYLAKLDDRKLASSA